MKDALDGFINAKTMLSEGGGIWPPESKSPYLAKHLNAAEPSDSEDGANLLPPSTKTHPLLQTHIIHPLQPGSTVPLPRLPPPQSYTATAFACDHTVPCLGYLFSAVTPKLKPEYRSLSGPQLRALREDKGVELTAPVSTPVFAFLGDTTASTLAAAPSWLEQGVKVVITECSFLLEEHRTQAERTRHTIWADLEPVVRRWPGTVFVLMHFSMRYSDDEVRRFFRSRDVPGNVVVWVDGEGDGGEGA